MIDLWRYLKTELYVNWKERSKDPNNSRDKYFVYALNSPYKPEERHFSHFIDMDDLSPEKIAKDLRKIVAKLEE